MIRARRPSSHRRPWVASVIAGVGAERLGEEGRERLGCLPRQRLQFQRAQQNPGLALRRADQQPFAVAGADLAHDHRRELVAQFDDRPVGGFRFAGHRKNARFWVRSTDSSSCTTRSTRRYSPGPSRCSRSVRPAETKSAPRSSPRLRNNSTADSTRYSGPPTAKVRTLDTWWRIRDGGSSVNACSVAKRATRLRSEYRFSSRWLMSGSASNGAPRAVVTRTGTR